MEQNIWPQCVAVAGAARPTILIQPHRTGFVEKVGIQYALAAFLPREIAGRFWCIIIQCTKFQQSIYE